MARLKTILTADNPYHLYARVNNREDYPIPLNQVWDIYVKTIEDLKSNLVFVPHHLVVMPNHFHLVGSTPKSNISAIMRDFMLFTTQKINTRAGKINRLYGGRYRWTVVQGPYYFYCLERYVYQNPTRSFIVNKVQDYPWSTLVKDQHLMLKNESFSEYIPPNGQEYLDWLNQNPPEDFVDNMKRALRRKVFKFPVDKNGQWESGKRFL